MAFITQFNAHRIIRKINPISLSRLTGDVYEKPIYIYSDKEKQELLALKQLLSDPSRFIDEYYVGVTVVDTGTWVYPEKEPRFHHYPDCERLLADWHNYPVPEAIKKRGMPEVYRFRDWWKKHYNLYQHDRPTFYIQLSADFHISKQDIDAADRQNSDYTSMENMSLPELKEKIDELLSLAGKFYYKTEKNTEILKSFQKKTFLARSAGPIKYNTTKYPDDEIKKLLGEYDRLFKTPIKEMLIQYYKVKYNPELSFEANLLERLGFIECYACETKTYEELDRHHFPE